MKNILSRIFWLVPAIALTLSSCSKSGDKATDSTGETDIPVFENLDAYMAVGTTASVRENRLREKPEYDRKTTYVIYGVDMNSDNFKKGDFQWIGDTPYDSRPECDLDGITYPFSRAVVAPRKSTIYMLAPDADTYIIDGKKATRAQFDALPGDSLQRITIDGRTLIIEKRLVMDKPNVEIDKLGDDEGRMMRLSFFDEMRKRHP